MQSFTDNFDSKFYNEVQYIKFDKKKKKEKKEKVAIAEKLEIKLKDYLKNSNNQIFCFFESKDREKKNYDDLIIAIEKIDEEKYTAKTGNYIGNFIYGGIELDIRSRFDDIFLKRMLNFANDVYLNNVDAAGEIKKQKNMDYSKFIIYYLFLQKLERAFLLGLPKAYTTVKHHDLKFKGKIDINRFIKNDIPFKGKISSKSREQKEIQEIVDVLYKAVIIIEKDMKGFIKNISHIKTHLKQHKSKDYVSNKTIQKALSSKALNNSIFAPYKKILEYAKMIIGMGIIEQNKNAKNSTYGFLVNVAALFEIYITKLLQKEFIDWSISSPHIRLDSKDEFNDNSYLYARKIIPDITMIHDTTKEVIVFDTKYKKMKFDSIKGNGSDIDRCDFFQINTYMNYYNNQEEYTLLGGGLLYPLEIVGFDDNFIDGKEQRTSREYKAHTSSWFGNTKTKFIVDGIDLSKNNLTIEDIVKSEKAFIERIKKISGEY